MKSTRYINHLDKVGRIELPKSMRQELSIGYQSPLEIFVNSTSIVLMEYRKYCSICDNTNNLENFKGKHICQNCINEIVNL
ncbi:AbrB/MazE/SpoVT family DNA-binding domain-containing protein [Wukongibacter sp. M2B1]|uniref:AbrB/MazE/SpoVT family DNA-binding domain-containing protein n=1 Tax=Wukongibacter sp. M2B1 TaxID=3088895 RepID=UPI003D7B7E22